MHELSSFFYPLYACLLIVVVIFTKLNGSEHTGVLGAISEHGGGLSTQEEQLGVNPDY